MSEQADTFTPGLAAPVRIWPVLTQSLLVHWPFYILALAYALTTYVLLRDVPGYVQAPLQGLAFGIIKLTIPAGLFAVLLFRLLQYAVAIRPESPLRQMKQDIAGIFRKPAPLILALPLLVAMIVFNKGMLELKPMIPVLKPFAYDTAFMELDRALHFGFDPWVLLQPVMGFDVVTFVINMAYNMWFLALFGTFMWFGFARVASALRTQFFVSYMLCWWLGGGLLALQFSSAGPAYYGLLGLSPDPFAPLLAYLHDVDSRIPILALDTQQLLWDGYTGKVAPIGISAFPSMHNASAVLFALAAWRVNRAAGIGFALYALVILLGSVHIGWHYAVDGYAAVGLALLFWWLAGHFARWHEGLVSTRRLNAALSDL
jgi:hypothetical protein